MEGASKGSTKQKKYIFVTGGVISGLGKGIVSASLGRLLKSRGYIVTLQKFDPYLNVDAGTTNPFEHGEVFVTEDGMEADLDLGHYERFIDEELTRDGDLTSGVIYGSVIDKERMGVYDGASVQIVPHITNEIKERILGYMPGADISIVEIGGTVGDIESMVYLEAIRQFSNEIGKQNCAFVHVVLMPYIQASGEQKTKPAQHSVKELLGLGISPDFIVCRSERPLSDDSKGKVALFCNVAHDHVIANEDAGSIYEVPLKLHAELFDAKILIKLGLEERAPELDEWRAMVRRLMGTTQKVVIALVGKYIDNLDAYYSVMEALRHSGAGFGAEVKIKRVDSEKVSQNNAARILGDVDGIIVPSGFGSRGVEGMIQTARFAREQKIPYFGLGLGMQAAVVEFARNVLGYADAAHIECDPGSARPVINLMSDQLKVKILGGTMRLGEYPCELAEGSISQRCYNATKIKERHRHRHEFNNDYRDAFEGAGALLAGRSPDGKIIEVFELPQAVHPWFVSVLFHPEFKSRPNRPHPLFCGFVEACLAHRDQSGQNAVDGTGDDVDGVGGGNDGGTGSGAGDGNDGSAGGGVDGVGSGNDGGNDGGAGSGADSDMAGGVDIFTRDSKPHEACGVIGVYSEAGAAAGIAYNALLSLQHRGQESAGIAVLKDASILCHKDVGLVTGVFSKGLSLPEDSRLAIGHVRYSTNETHSIENAQPFIAEYLKGRIAGAHNGNIINSAALRDKLAERGAAFATGSDSELISSLIAFEALTNTDLNSAIVAAAEQLEGAFSIVLLSHEGKLAALRDGWGFKPLCIGRNEYGYAVTSESCALECMGYEFVRDVRPGEMVIIDADGLHSAGVVLERPIKGVCAFEYVYFARPDSIIDGQGVYSARVRMGEILALEHPVDADVVCGVPETGLDAAAGFGRASRIAVKPGFIKNGYVGRSFIYPTQNQREAVIKLKLNPLRANVAGKRVVLVDDSMVRGTTCAKIIKSLKLAGALEVHVRISSPQFLHKCHFGTDIASEDTLISHKMDVDGICKLIGADSLGFISIAGLHEACAAVHIPLCDGCLSGEYPAGACDESAGESDFINDAKCDVASDAECDGYSDGKRDCECYVERDGEFSAERDAEFSVERDGEFSAESDGECPVEHDDNKRTWDKHRAVVYNTRHVRSHRS